MSQTGIDSLAFFVFNNKICKHFASTTLTKRLFIRLYSLFLTIPTQLFPVVCLCSHTARGLHGPPR